MSMIIDGTNGLTFNNATTQASAGVVLQVVSMISTSSTSTSSAAWTSTALTQAITPKFSNSKILILVSTDLALTAGNQAYLTIFRNSTNLGSGSNSAFVNTYVSNSSLWTPTNISYLDSPSTTSSTTYTVNLWSASGSVTANYSITGTLTLMEIAG